MATFVTVTSQGQISIPMALRNLLGLDVLKKVLVDVQDNKIIIEPVGDILSLAGVLSHKAKKDKTSQQILLSEETALSQAFTEKHQR
ncbi:AbrB/MazE/SpoVT family DNA-binding domain-containing protein [Patescibacteria group bacterium]|nr:AbrB/MazE/SpoVT family DNA-binding domain-containing protein [Patescibacteria group bacterium]